MVIKLLTAHDNVNETSNPEEVLATSNVPEFILVYAGAGNGYRSAKNEELLSTRKLKSRILHKATKRKPLTEREKLSNNLTGKIRFKVEQTLGGTTGWFNSTVVRFNGILKMHTQNPIVTIALNPYRSIGIFRFKLTKTVKL